MHKKREKDEERRTEKGTGDRETQREGVNEKERLRKKIGGGM